MCSRLTSQAIELVKEDLETHTGLFVESLEVYSGLRLYLFSKVIVLSSAI